MRLGAKKGIFLFFRLVALGLLSTGVTLSQNLRLDVPDKIPSFSGSLNLIGVDVPIYKYRGEDAELFCHFERGQDPLYSVQWYKDDMEFFRYMFRNNPPNKVFSEAGLNVDENRSNERRVLLHKLAFNSTGIYRCEVSADAPHFRTYTKESRMVVVEFPKGPPTITSSKNHYRVGEKAWLNCTSSKSHPVSQLTWFINGEKAPKKYLRSFNKWIHLDGLRSRRLELSFTVEASHYAHGNLVLKCVAAVWNIYAGADEQDLSAFEQQREQKITPVILKQHEYEISISSGSGFQAISNIFLSVSVVMTTIFLVSTQTLS